MAFALWIELFTNIYCNKNKNKTAQNLPCSLIEEVQHI